MVDLADYRGARGSNAGDEFHELWALEQVLALLAPNTELRAVKVEGVRTGGSGADTNEPFWDSVDCSLYFGGSTLEAADAVELVQLKYSSDPSRAWSVARLTASSAKTGNNSILRKLADDYQSARPRMKPEAALKLRFVSNQALAPAVNEAVKAGARGDPYAAAVAKDLACIEKATGLRGPDRINFLASLDLSGCAADSRFRYRERVIRTVAKLLEDRAADFAAELKQRVRELMLPERHRDIITFETVLAWFGVADRAGLFPCPAEITSIESPVARQATIDLVAAIAGGAKLVCLHGPAGCGKSTVLNELQSALPDGSRVVLFDCYGGGRYRFSNDKRHLPEHAFLQITSDVAVSLATPFFIPRSGSQPIDIRRFLTRLRDAAHVLKTADPGALLIIAIDAADNAVTAANLVSPNEPCFLSELAGADLNGLPTNLRLVMSSRTARVSSLGLPKHTPTVECPAFSKDETSRYAQARWPDVSTDWIEQFYHLSNGIPRVQAYATTAAHGDPLTRIIHEGWTARALGRG